MRIKRFLAVALCGLAFFLLAFIRPVSASINSQAEKYPYGGVTYLYKILAQRGIKYNKFYTKNKIVYRKGKPEGIVIHETADPGATAMDEAIFFNREWMHRYAYVHAFVDDTGVIQMMTPNYGVWGAGPMANNRFVQIELCEETDPVAFLKSINNDAIYSASILHRYHLKPNDAAYDGKGTVWSHHAVSRFLGGTDHVDPDSYFAQHGYRFSQFYQLIKYYYQKQAGTKPAKPAKPSKGNSGKKKNQRAVKKTIMHNAYVYNAKHKRVGKEVYKIGQVIKTYGSQEIGGSSFYKLARGKFVDAGNIDGQEMTLTHNAYVYDKRGRRANKSKLYKGQNVTGFGAPVKIKGKKYQIIGLNQYVKTGNLN